MQVVAIDKSLHPIFLQDGSLKVDEAKLFERVLVPQTTKYHLGWIRPFKQQVDKHIRHVNERRWGEHGDRLLKGAKVELELWAVVHVLGYNQIPSVPIEVKLPQEMESFADMRYTAGSERVFDEFEKKYGTSVLKMQAKLKGNSK